MAWDTSPERMAQLRQSIQPISTDLPLKEVLAQDFPNDCADLPITGGWGYSMANAIIFERRENAPPWARNFVSLEYHIAQKIIYEELIIFRTKGSRFSGIDLKTHSQGMTIIESRKYDCLDLKVTCWSDAHWEYLKGEWESNDNGRRPDFDLIDHRAKRLSAQIEYKRQLWFNITDVFG